MFTALFEKYSTRQMAAFSLIILISSVFLSIFFHLRFDGVVDLHLVEEVSWTTALLDLIASWGILWICLMVYGKWINKKVRGIDVWNSIGVARVAYVLLALLQIIPGIEYKQSQLVKLVQAGNFDFPPSLLVFVALLALISILGTILFVMLLYSGIKVATNMKTNAQLAFFFVALVVAEFLSKVFLMTVASV